MTDHSIELLEETGRWNARDVSYFGGPHELVLAELPNFELRDFKVGPGEPANPHLRSVVRLPRKSVEREMPVGVVSNNYTLAQHSEVAMQCLVGMQRAGVNTEGLGCEVGLTDLGEGMNLRIYFPDEYSKEFSDGNKVGLRVECFNTVDGTGRLVILLGWIRFICSNGIIIGETKMEFKDIHNKRMDLEKIPEVIVNGMEFVEKDVERMRKWEEKRIVDGGLQPWIDGELTGAWGKKAAARVFHICLTGREVDFPEPFAKGTATKKPVLLLEAVPGAVVPVATLYDVGQALSWVASRRHNPDERSVWQTQIPELLKGLRAA